MLCTQCGYENLPEARFCGKCGTALATLWVPGIGSSYKNGWRQLWKHFPVLLLIGIVYVLISSASSVFSVVGTGRLGFLAWAYGILLINPIGYGVAFTYLKAARDNSIEVKDMFVVFRNYWNIILASLLIYIVVAIGILLLIIPGIIFACKLAFTPYLVVDRKITAVEAIKESWRMTDGHAWKVFIIGLLALPISIAGLICFGVGIIVAIMWVNLSFAALYHAVSKFSEASSQQVVPVA